MRDPNRVRASTLYRLVAEVGGPALTSAGFARVDKRTWVRDAKASIREVIGFAPPRWGTAPWWGLSLDYVPYVSNRRDYVIDWKAANELVAPDLSYNPLDYFWDQRDQWLIPATEGRERAAAAAEAVLGRTLALATQFFDPVESIADLPAAFENKRSRQHVRYGAFAIGWLHGQELLAYALTLARLGRADEGRVWLERFKEREPLMPRTTRRELGALFDQAVASP